MSTKGPHPDYKAVLEPTEIFIGLVIGVCLTAFMLVDYSVLTLDNPIFTAQYYIWKSQAAFVKILITVFSFTVPLSILGTVVGFIQIFTRKSTFVRHFLDLIHLGLLFYILYITAVFIAPSEQHIIDSAMKADISQITHIINSGFYDYFTQAMIIQVALLFLPLIKYYNGVNNPIPLVDLPAPAKKGDKQAPKLVDANSDNKKKVD